MFKKLTQQPFWVNLLVAIGIALLLLFIFLRMLGWITRHGDFLTVPAVTGKKTNEAIKLLEKQGFTVKIQDSVYTDTAARGTVLKQLPDPNATVKINRTVFLTVNREIPPMIEMPKLEGLSLNFALDMLERNHLKLQDTLFRPNFMLGSVLEQQYNGQRIPEKTKVQWGSKITLIIGSGLGDEQMMVPDLVGMTVSQARSFLQEKGIELGAIVATGVVKDTANAFIYMQNPSRFDEDNKPVYIQSGQVMDVYISAAMISPKDSADTKDKTKKKHDND
ncbi:MAG: PASTA domain-containing protein [Ferruginibacter sp.]